MKRTVRWMLAVLVLIGIVFSIGLAGAEEGKTLEIRFTVPAEDMPRLRSGEGLTGDEQATATFSRNPGGSTCVAYTYAVNNGSTGGQVTQYRYVMGILDDFRPGNNTADTLYKSNLISDSELTYTFYQTGNYVLFVYRYDANNQFVSPLIYQRIYITQDSASNPLTAAVNSAAADCNMGNDFDTAVAINDYLAGLNTYDDSYTYYSPEAALLGVQVNGTLTHTSVCNGYSRAYQLIAEACGLECRRVTGIAGGGGHAWNAVKVNGNWYHVDPTWNDSKMTSNGQVIDNSIIRHIYALLDDKTISTDHNLFDYPQGRVSCYTLADNYFIHENKWRVLIPDGSGNPMANVQEALDTMTGAEATITADYGKKVWREDGGQLGFTKGKLTINGNIVAYALSRTDLYRSNDANATTPIRGSFFYTYNEADTPASKLTGEVTAGTIDPERVQLTVPEGNNGQLPTCTKQSITITMAPGATQYGFYDGEFWMNNKVTSQKNITMEIAIPTAGEKTLIARAYYESADGTGEWVYSNAETRTFTAAEPLDQAEISIRSDYLNFGITQGTDLPVTFHEAEGAETYVFQVVNEQQEEVYQSLTLNAEDLEELTGGRKGRIITVPTDGMPVDEITGKANYVIRVYASAEGREDSCSEALMTLYEGTPADEPYIHVDKTEALIGQNVAITVHIPGAAYVGAKWEKGYDVDNFFCDPVEGDTGIWTVCFDWAGVGEYTLSATGWSGALWDENENVINPDLPANPVTATVTVTALQEEEEPETYISIPSPLTEDSIITVSFDPFPGATLYAVSCEQEINSDKVYYRSGMTPFTAEIPAAWLRTDQTYRLDVEVYRTGYYPCTERYQLIRSDFDGDSFTIALEGVNPDADGIYHVNTCQDYTLVCTGLPEGMTDIAVLMYGDAWYENEVNANGQATIQIWEPGTGIPLMVRYEDGDGVTHYSNLLTLTAAENTGCPHTEYEFVWDNISEPVYEEIEGNNQDHKVTRVLGEFMQCTLCGENLGRTDTPAETEETVEQHEYDENGVCTLCRHVNTCEHAECHELIWVYPNENEVIHRYDEEGFEADDLQHMVSGDGFTYLECGDCGMTFNRQDLPGTTTVGKPHHYVNGVCDECGYGCSHSVMEEESEFDHYAYYTKNGDEHITVPVYAVTHSCRVCGYRDPALEPEWVGVTEAHEDGDEDGLCDLCGASMNQSWGWDYVNGNTLILSGSGAVDGFDTMEDLPWFYVIGSDYRTRRVIIEDGITGLGKNVLAGFKDGIRVDFYTKAQPATTADTFGGKEVVCRYYDNTNAWDGTAGGETVTWIYLPVREGGDCFALAYYQEDGKNAPTWHLRENIGASSAQDVEIDRAAAMEYSQEQIAVILDAIPTIASGDRAVIENRNIAMAAVFTQGCSGEYTLDFSAFPNIDVQLDIDAPNLALTITGPTGQTDPLYSMDVRSASGIACDWTIADLRLRNTQAGCVTDVYVDGDVENLSYYDATSDMPFTGELTVMGRIIKGTVYGQNELQVPGVTLNGTPVRFGSLDTATFTYENSAEFPELEQVIQYDETEQKSQLNPAVNRQNIGNLTLDMFKLTYQYWGPGRVAFGVDPKEGTGLGEQGGYIDNILEAEYNPSFTTDDIIWGDDTTVYFMDTGETAYTLNGGTDGSGNRTGVGAIYLQNCNVTVNCPAGFIKTWQYKNDLGPVNLTINDTVDKAEVMFFRDGGRIHLGANGAILEGVWDRGKRGYREIGAVWGECDYAVDGALRVLSAKDGQRTRAIPASDKAVSAAASLSGQTTASMDVNDSSISQIGAEQTAVLDGYLAARGLSRAEILNVFDVSVTEYTVDEDGIALDEIGSIDRLNRGVLVTVGNDSGEAVSVVRLHEDEHGDIKAERLTGSVSGVKVQFTSDLFSTYVLVKGEAELDPANLTKLTLPASLKRVEESAFEGIAAQAVIVPQGCEYIGSKAFKDCPNLVYIEYYEGTEVADDAFAECNSLQVKVIPVQ